MVAKKQPTNSDLAVKLDQGLSEIRAFGRRLERLEAWKVQEDTYKAVYKQIRQEESQERKDKLSMTESTTRNQLLQRLLYIAGIVALILGSIAATRGLHP